MGGPWEDYAAPAVAPSGPWSDYQKPAEAPVRAGTVIPDDQTTTLDKVRAVGAIAGNTGTFGIGQRVAAGAEAAVDTIKDRSILDDKSVISRWKASYDEIMQRGKQNVAQAIDETSATLPVIGKVSPLGVLGTGIGYALNPISRLTAATGGVLTTAISAGTTVGAVEGGTNFLDGLEAIANGANPHEVTQSFVENTAKAAGSAALLAGTIRLATSPVAVAGKSLKEWALKRAPNLNPDAQVLIENAARAPKSSLAAQEALDGHVAEIAKIYTDVNTALKEGLEQPQVSSTGRKLSAYVEDWGTDAQKALNTQAASLLSDIQSKAPSRTVLQEHLGAVAGLMENIQDMAQKTYGQELEAIAAKVPGKSIDLTEEISAFKQEYANIPGSGVALKAGDASETLQIGSHASPVLRKFLNEVSAATKPTFKQAVMLKQKLGQMIPWSRGQQIDPRNAALVSLWNGISDKLGDETVIGREAATHYSTIRDAYKDMLGISGDAVRAAKSLGKAAQYTDNEMFDGRLTTTLKTIENANVVAKQLGSAQNPLVIFDAPQQQIIRSALEDVRKSLDIRQVAKQTIARDALKEMATKSSYDDLSKNAAKIKELVGDVTQLDAAREALDKRGIADVILNAVKNPLDKKAVSAAHEYIGAYAGTAKGEISNLLNRAAMIERTENLTTVNNVSKALKAGNLDPSELAATRLTLKLEPRIADIVADSKIAQAYLNENPSLVRTLTGRSPEAVTADVAIPTAIGLAMHSTPAGFAAAVSMGMIRMLQNPTAALLFAERNGLSKSFFNPQTLIRVSQIASFAGKAVRLSNAQ